MKFVAIDVETANSDFASICQVGVAVFDAGVPIEIWHSLVNPEDYFDQRNIEIHGIEKRHVVDSPKFPEIAEALHGFMRDQIVIHHTAFDKVSSARVHAKYEIEHPACVWLDTARVARRAWPKISHSGYGLDKVAQMMGIEFKHHAAQEDARAAGEILVHAIAHTGIGLGDWLTRSLGPLNLNYSTTHEAKKRTGNPEGPMAGEVLVFTGSMTMARGQASDLAAEIGCRVAPGVNQDTTLLVVGDQDIRQTAGHEKSSKHRKAESLMAKGQSIRIIGESDFLLLLKECGDASTGKDLHQ